MSPDYVTALSKSHTAAKERIDGLLNENHLDAICGLTIGPAHSTDLIYGDRFGDVYAGSAAAITGYPHITVPCGFVWEMPVGISFFGTAWSEPQLISIAYAFEQSSKIRKPPAFVNAF